MNAIGARIIIDWLQDEIAKALGWLAWVADQPLTGPDAILLSTQATRIHGRVAALREVLALLG